MDQDQAVLAPALSPVESHKDEILEGLREHDALIVVAPTGTGKSTQIPIMLLDIAELVIVTQPRRVAAEALARRVSIEQKSILGELVGFQTATKAMRSLNTRILYCTDGIEVLHQLHSKTSPQETIYVIDEVHEWNENLEVLIAWFKYLIDDGEPVKLVILSATVEADRLSEFFNNAPIINCEGKKFPIRDLEHSGGVVSAAVRLLKRGLNVLVFVPGKQEIRETISGIMRTDVKAKCLPFHADLGADDVSWVFESFDEPKCVVATTIAQTSLTIPDIDAVVDSGLERGNEYKHGVEGLYTKPTSLAERTQRRGRAGRTKPGIYIDCLKVPGLEERDKFSTPAINRHELSGMVLQILAAGYDPETFAFFHEPDPGRLEEARQTLSHLGFLDQNRRLTRKGKQAARLPVPPRAARMVLEAVDDENRTVDYNAVTLATLFSHTSSLEFKTDEGRELIMTNYDEVGVSDAFMHLKTYDAACLVPIHLLSTYGIERTTFDRLKEHRSEIVDRLMRMGYAETNAHSRLDTRYVVAGLSDLVFTRSKVSSDYTREGTETTPRKLPHRSTITAERIVGMPWNFETHTDMGPVVRRLLLWATVIPD